MKANIIATGITLFLFIATITFKTLLDRLKIPRLIGKPWISAVAKFIAVALLAVLFILGRQFAIQFIQSGAR